MRKDAIMINEKDNVGNALRDIQPGERITIGIGDKTRDMLIQEHIPYGHKFAIRDIRKGEDILKYGEVIGKAKEAISAGAHTHVHNIESLRGRGDLETKGV